MSSAYIVRRAGGVGSASAAVIIELQTDRGDGRVDGVEVTVMNVTDTEGVFATFSYDGPHTVMIPAGMRYRVHVGDIDRYHAPQDVEYTAVAGIPRYITMNYIYATRYGFRRDKNDSSPDTRITYLFDADGREPMYVDLSTGEPQYGGWKEFIDGLARPVMLRYDGTVDYELDHDDQTRRADNGEASDVASASYAGNAMVEFGGPFKWVKRYEDEDYEYVVFCDLQYDDDYHAYAHTNESGEVKDAFYWGMFEGTYSSSRLRSIGTGSIMTGQTRASESSRARANGDGYYRIYKSGWDFICDILTLVSRNDNSQSVFGMGRCKSSNSGPSAAGTLKNTGAFWGSGNETSGVKTLYIENFWGNVWESMEGFVLDRGNGIKVKMTPPYNESGDGYEATGVTPSGEAEAFVDMASVSRLGYVPKSTNGSSTTFFCDIFSYNTANVSNAHAGARWSHGDRCGSRAISLSNSIAGTGAPLGTRLAYIQNSEG